METSNRPVIVLVDDEDMVITSIASFLALETDYEIHGFTSASKAMEFIGSHEVDLVVSDYLMPETDGMRFLAKVRGLRPQATRILLTGFADKKNVIRGINDVGLYKHLEKPWANEELKVVIQNGLEKHVLLRRLEQKIAEVSLAQDELMTLQKDVLRAFA
jgi:response regulator RpfG family c-di-GMP phosphodiesterase